MNVHIPGCVHIRTYKKLYTLAADAESTGPSSPATQASVLRLDTRSS